MDSRKDKEETKKALSYSTLQVTIRELNAHHDLVLENKLKGIIENNKIERPEFHHEPGENWANSYRIDLSDTEIDRIAELFMLKATEFVQDGEATATFVYYESMAEEWLSLK